MRIKELLKELISTQKEINKSIKDLKEDLKPKFEGLTTTISRVGRLENSIETNIFTKEQTINAINKEYDYRENFKECDEKNPALLNLIEDYCKFENKYEIVDLFRVIDSQYEVKARSKNK